MSLEHEIDKHTSQEIEHEDDILLCPICKKYTLKFIDIFGNTGSYEDQTPFLLWTCKCGHEKRKYID